MAEPFISIIIPMYNTQEYVIQCLTSIKAQTYTDYEVIIVNDGSTDDCEKTVSDYISVNALCHFHLINKKNGGISSARNEGLKYAKGEWVTFLDSDDWLEETFLENLAKTEKKYHADLILTGFKAYDIFTGEYDVWSHYTADYGVLPQELKSLKSMDYVWSRMYKKSILDEHSIVFDERVKFCEDNAFNLDYVSVIQSFACTKEIGYVYRRGHPGALSKTAVTPFMRKYIREHLYSFYEKVPEETILAAFAETQSFVRILWNISLTDVVVDILENNSAEAKKKMKKTLTQALVKAFKPGTNKDKVFHFLWNRSFLLFRLCVLIFYKNIEKIKKNKKLSHFLTH